MNYSCTPFVRKTFQLVSDVETNQTVSWSKNGFSFTIWDVQSFQQIILPKYFKHSNLCSFVRQLNTYGFHKSTRTDTTANGIEFSNSYFRCGSENLLHKITRKNKSVSTQPKKKEEKIMLPKVEKPQVQSNHDLASAIIDLLRRQQESEKQLRLVCKELAEAKSVIGEISRLPIPTTTMVPICGKRTENPVVQQCPPAKIARTEQKYQSLWEDFESPYEMVSFDDVLQSTSNYTPEYSFFPNISEAVDLRTMLLDF